MSLDPGFETALRLAECLAALALLQQSAEQMAARDGTRNLGALRALLALALLAGLAPGLVAAALLGTGIMLLRRYDGPYNGGSDRMTLLILACLAGARLLPGPLAAETAFGYLALQAVLSYVVSGWVKIRNPDWRSGRALRDVFAVSAYPVSRVLRRWARRPRLLAAAGWAVMLFELGFPLALADPRLMAAALVVGAGFHLANALLFGLNRFLWIWIASYPALIWLQARLPP